MDSAILKATQSLTTAEDMRTETKCIMQPYANWEQYLTPAPLSIAILGELVFISSSTDFSLSNNPPEGGYKFINHPTSFCACLMQVCHSGWWAFSEAHSSMDQIRLHTAQIPDYMKTAVKILFQDNDEIVKAHLPDQLENIQYIADECLTLANAAEKRFTDVINIIHELLQVCMSANKFYGDEMETVKNKLEECKLKEQSALVVKQMSEKALRDMEQKLEQAHESYKKAMDSLPSGWGMIGMDVIGGITQSVTGLINGVTSVITHPVRNMCSASTKIVDTFSNFRDQESKIDMIAEMNSYSMSAGILLCVQKIKQLMNVDSKDDDIDWKNLYDQKSKCTKSDFINIQFERIDQDLKKIPDCPAKKEAQDLCKNGMTICNQLEEYAPHGKCDKEKSTEIIQAVFKLMKSAHIFDCKSKDITNSPAISPTPPMMYREVKKLENMSPSQMASENARFAIEQTRAQLNKTTETCGNHIDNLMKNQEELAKILVDMRNCQLKEIDFKTTIQMLVKGMEGMGKVKEQWVKMVRFFNMVSNIVKTSLSKTLKNFVKTSNKTNNLSYNEKLFSKDLLYIQAFQACNIASLVHMISATYTDVSNKYLMDRVSSLDKLMVMDKSSPEFKSEQQKLRNGCDEACEGILKLVLKNKAEFERKSTARLERIDRELLAILPAAPPEQIKRIQEAVQAGFTEKEEEEASYS